jgi:hypothetical protein
MKETASRLKMQNSNPPAKRIDIAVIKAAFI